MTSTEISHSRAFIYPTQGQSREQQNQDLGECYTQAKEETDFDPSRPIPKKDRESQPAMRRRQERIQTYNQIVNACLQKRGYRVQ
ncbi:hypothetical protein HC931_26305 [Candidatus Gracilibacteria bacterium]|nr:hypothetical protein [Candidatus Gracilibacteria bacterium]NJM90163.1 hypothetical protein [Hydrococcus sp. RU_2_2]NJP22014.1 hypothetical protein [Hydrococcus sp. CRU_1_1]